MQPNLEGPTVKNMVDMLCQVHDTYPFDTNKHFFLACTPQITNSILAEPGGWLWYAARQLSVHARSTATVTSPSAPQASRPARLRVHGQLRERNVAQHGPKQSGPAIASLRLSAESPCSSGAKQKRTTNHELSNRKKCPT